MTMIVKGSSDEEESLPANMTPEDLVDLVDKPAWKAILLDLVRKEKMDPWDVDVTVLADSYLKRINSMKEFDFLLPANAVLAASIMLSFKARNLRLSALSDIEESMFDLTDDVDNVDMGMVDEDGEPLPFDPETGEMGVTFRPELKDPERAPARRVSLDELVSAVQVVMDRTQLKHERVRERKKNVHTPDFPTLKLAKQNMEKSMKDIHEEMWEKKDSQNLVLFSNITDSSMNAKVIIEKLMPILHLANERHCDVWQDEAFSEIFIRMINEPGTKPKGFEEKKAD